MTQALTAAVSQPRLSQAQRIAQLLRLAGSEGLCLAQLPPDLSIYVRGSKRQSVCLWLRFWDKVLIGTREQCWEWQASLSSGYGQFMPAFRNAALGGSHRAHRVAYTLLIGPVPDGLTLDHLCRNRRCVNPAHLEPVDVRTNNLRGFSPAAENALVTVCVHGHPLEGSNVYRWKNRRYCVTCRARLDKEYKQRLIPTPAQRELRRAAVRRYRARHLEELRERDRAASRARTMAAGKKPRAIRVYP